MKISPSFIPRLKREEGFSATPYWDRTHWTWGHGTKAPGQYGTITPEQAEDELLTYVSMAEGNYLIVFQADPPGLTQARYDSIIDMLYNLGLGGFSAFTYTLAAIRAGEWEKAAAHAQQSLWYRQVGRRARRIVEELRTGVGMYEDAVPPPSPSSVPVPASTAVASGIWAAILTMLSKLIRGVRR